jgi:hypothetical protein
MGTGGMSDHRPWHALLAPLPQSVVPRVSPLVPADSPPSASPSPIAGWESLVLELSAEAAGVRIVQVLLDADGRLLSASDHVLFRFPPTIHDAGGEPAVLMRQESIGGRFEVNGDFKGTCWLITGPEPVDEEAPQWEMTPREPTPQEVAALRTLVAEIMRRRGHP